MNAPTAGKGDPYWYEWTVGLLRVVEMLRPESEIKSVSFQVTGAKGWDDVVVNYADNRSDFIQVKHSRVGKNITFGDLVSTDDQGVSLLSGLLAAWTALPAKEERSKYILFTNRTAGESAGRSSNGVLRPPLFKFISWLKPELIRVNSLSECRPPDEWVDAWKEWLAQLQPGTTAEQLSFLRSFEVQANQEDLQELEASVHEALCSVFQIPVTKARPLFHALDSALRRWTTTKEKVTVEDAFSAMALDEEIELEHRAPPPPAPFFPSRQTVLEKIEAALKDANRGPIVFLCADPGAGKTSVVSQLANCRVADAFQGLVGLRYFAFSPITPDSPLIPPDADHFVRPDRLWFRLLSQLRQGLKGKLSAYQVPLRNDLLTWPEARTHVLRISERLGRELGRPFVIVVDGIDHAARAMRYEAAQAKEFFDSLPSPDEIGDKPLRLLLAGQPPEFYPEYPSWLRTAHPRVERLGIGRLDETDIRIELRETKSTLAVSHEDATVRLIETTTNGNTLAVVFAVQESRSCSSLDELRARLDSRHLGDGLQRYYRAIWEHALACVVVPPVGLEVALATALCLTPERLNSPLMASAFAPLQLAVQQWQMLLASLGPLIVEETDGFRVLHNDVRVFLHSVLDGQPLAARRQTASLLANHYLRPESNRLAAHRALRRLLRDADREVEWARVFNVDWVFEAAALGILSGDMSADCVSALRQGLALQDWSVMQELACATETLWRWDEQCDLNRVSERAQSAEPSPAFLHTEAFVRPLAKWQITDLHDLIRDTRLLLAHDENARANALLHRWLGGLSVSDLCRSVEGLVEPQSMTANRERELAMGEHQTIESLGSVCRTVNLDLKGREPMEGFEHAAEASFEAGWVRASSSDGPFDSINAYLGGRQLHYLSSFRLALQGAAGSNNWSLVRKLLAALRPNRDRLSPDFKAQAAWWALRSDEALDDSGWLDVLSSPDLGLIEQRDEKLPAALAVSRALGWKDVATDGSATAQKIFDAMSIRPDIEDSYRHYRLFFRAAATLGRVASLLHRRGVDAAAAILPPTELGQLVAALWEYPFASSSASLDRGHAGQLASQAVSAGLALTDAHRDALLESAKPFADKYPVDQRRHSLWKLYRRVGDTPRLRGWVQRWLAEDGWLWTTTASERESIAEDLLPLACEVGEHQLANKAQERLCWLQITYRGHDEAALDTPVRWLGELTGIEPPSWLEMGLHLWRLSEACSALGGDNLCAWDLGETLGAAAWGCGPEDVWRLFTAEYPDCGTDSWLHPTAGRIIGGLTEHLRRCPNVPFDSKLAGWCLAVGLSRWFNNEDIRRLADLRDTLIETATNETEAKQITEAIKRLTPGEATRNPRRDSSDRASSAEETDDADILRWLNRIDNGEQVPPRTASMLIRKLYADQPDDFGPLAKKVLSAVGVGAPYSWNHYSFGTYGFLLEISHLASDKLLWSLVSAATRYAGDGLAWTQNLCRNLNNVLLARAASRGATELRTGLVCLLRMHERWARGGRADLQLPVITLAPPTNGDTWAEMAARCLSFMLASRSGEIIESTLIGVHALAAHDPRTMAKFIELAEGDSWKQYWILNAAESWAALAPQELNNSRQQIESWLRQGPLHQRMQAWIVLHQLAEKLGTSPPPFPNPTAKSGADETIIIQPSREILHSPGQRRGSFHFVDRFQSAESAISRVEAVTGAGLDRVRSRIAEDLMNLTPEDPDIKPWPVRIRGRGDTRINSLEPQIILDNALDECLRESPLPDRLEGPFTQAYLGNENPWILRTSPIPYDGQLAWPDDQELRGSAQNPQTSSAIRQALFLIATQGRLDPDEIVLAAEIQAFTYKEDFALMVWWEETTKDGLPTRSHSCPATLSGRTFAFSMNQWWEPRVKPEQRPLTFAVGGQHRLTLCFPVFLPARLWREEFGWNPAPDNPLIWMADGCVVARYERLHGPPRLTQSGHPRQPRLDRWLVKRSVWETLSNARGPFRMLDDFQQLASDVER